MDEVRSVPAGVERLRENAKLARMARLGFLAAAEWARAGDVPSAASAAGRAEGHTIRLGIFPVPVPWDRLSAGELETRALLAARSVEHMARGLGLDCETGKPFPELEASMMK